MRLSKENSALAKLRLAIGLRQQGLADLLGTTWTIVQNIELGKTELSDDLASDIAHLTGVNTAWLLENDISKPIVNRVGKPFTMDDYILQQAALKKRSMASPETDFDLRTVSRTYAERVANISAILLRAFELGRFDTIDFRLSKALRTIFVEAGGKDEDWFQLSISATMMGSPSVTRPDLSPLLAQWQTRLESLVATKTKGKLPTKQPRKRVATLPEIKPPRNTRRR